MTPAWVLDIFAAGMLIVVAVSAARLAAAWRWRRDTVYLDVDIAHLLMGISMTGMLAASLRTLPDTAWEVIFGALTAWFAWRVLRDARTAGVRALAGGHCAPHMVHSAAMLYMYLALVASAGTGSGMSGMGGTGTRSFSYPTLAFAFGLILAGYSVWDLDRLSGGRYRLAGATTTLATTTLAAPTLAAVPAGRPAGAAVSSRIAMGVTMAFMLFVMI